MPISSSLTASRFVRKIHCNAVHLTGRKSLGGASSQPIVAIRREDQSIWERRAPLAPHHVEQLVRKGVRFLIQPSNRRAYPLQSYIRSGAEAREDISEAQVVLGVKQVPVDQLLPGRTYCFFSHTIKAQEANMPLLDAVLDKKIRLIDYERMVDENDQRVVAFGRFAGVAGMINILHGLGLRLLALGHHTPFMHIGPAHNYRTSGTAKQAVRDAGYEVALGKMPRSIGPITFVFTGSGNVSQGAQEVFSELPIEFVDPSDLKEVAESGSLSKIYGSVVTRVDHLRRKQTAGNTDLPLNQLEVDLDECNQYPDRYYSTFSTNIAPYTSVLINGVYWPPNAPRLLTIPDAKKLQQPAKPTPRLPISGTDSIGSPALPHRLLAICDISADPGGSIEFMQDCSTIDNPFFLYDAETNSTSEQSFAGNGFLICSIDNMPTQLPLESTDMFGNLLMPYISDIVRSDAVKSVEEEKFSGAVQSAIIASNGKLQPNYTYIQDLRKQQENSQVKYKRATDTKEVLVLGAGHVSGPLIEYLCRDPKILVTVVSSLEGELANHRKHAQKNSNLRTLIMDVTQKQETIAEMIAESDLVVSLLPYVLHPFVARMCIEKKTNMVTASYLTPQMKELDEAAKEAGIVVLNEVGLDPGLDHLLAKQVIDEVAANGGKITSFSSYCCGLPTPEFADNPLGYKFGWNPEGAFAITMNGATWMENGQVCRAEPGRLMEYARSVDNFLKGFALESFPNRDSLDYQKLYNLPDAKTLIRGSLRYRGFSETILALRSLGLMDQNPQQFLRSDDGSELSWRQFMAEMMGHSADISPSNLKALIFEKVGRSKERLQAMLDLGIIDDDPVTKCGSPFDTIRTKIIRRYPFVAGENDLIIMRIIFDIEWPDWTKEKKSLSIVVYGDSEGGFSAMAKTVGYPAAVASKMVIEGEIQKKGMIIPLRPEIYHPMLKRLRTEGILARE